MAYANNRNKNTYITKKRCSAAMGKQIDQFIEKHKPIAYSNHKSAKNKGENTPPFHKTIIFKLIHGLKLKAGVKILEIGSGEVTHLPYLLKKANGMNYYGTNTSETMLQKALLSDALTMEEKWSRLVKVEEDGKLGFQDDFFDNCFSANSIYFWNNPLNYFMEIYRVLRSGGKFDLAFVEKKHGGALPWTQADFAFYEIDQVKDFFKKSGFVNIEVEEMTEEIADQYGNAVKRPFVILSGKK